jgi:Ca2+-binding EF-hand superfamily protein
MSLKGDESKKSVAEDIFLELDKDHDGKITREELRDGLRILKLPYSDEVLNALVEKLDADKNGEIS